MPFTKAQRNQLIAELVDNSDAWETEDVPLLNSMSDEKLSVLYEREKIVGNAFAIANSAVEGFSDGKNAYRLNHESGQWEKKAVTNDSMRCGTDDDNPNPEEEEEESYPQNRRRSSSTNNRRKPQTTDDWFKSAPDSIKETYRMALEVTNREKDKIISEILINSRVPESERAVHAERLSRRDIEELREDLALLPKISLNNEEGDDNPKPKRKRSRTNNAAEQDTLHLPKMEWGKVDDGKGTTSNQDSVHNSFDDEPMDEEEFLKNAPASIRQRVMNASRVEAAEREKLLDQITANMDEGEEQRLRNRFATKPLEELRDLLLLSGGKKSGGRTDYRGAAGGVINSFRNVAGDPDDVLVPPKIDWAEVSKNGK